MPEPTLCCRMSGDYCDRCDLLVKLPGLHVIAVERDGRDRLVVTVESAPGPMGCRSCGVVAHGHGRVNGCHRRAPHRHQRGKADGHRPRGQG